MKPGTVIILALLCTAPAVQAGLWDRDRPGRDDLPSAFDVITGRYDRLPAAVYEQRLQRLNDALSEFTPDGDINEDEAASTLDGLSLYDDAAAAHYRLGDYGAAILMLDRKSLQIERVREFHAARTRGHELRYLANKAACLQARWMKSGDRADLELAKTLLERILELDRHNWDAGWALTEVEWRLSNPSYDRTDPVFPNLLGLVDADFRDDYEPAALARNGIAGCIEYLSRRVVHEGMGRDVDIMYALSLGLTLAGQRQEAIFAWFRVGELLEDGQTTVVECELKPAALEQLMGVHLGALQEETDQRKIYRKLRDDSDAYVASRNDYVRRGLEEGAHPDTDSAFWAGWRLTDAGPPSPGRPPQPEPEPIMSKAVILGGVGALMGIFVLLFLAMMLLGRSKSPHPTVDEL